MRSKRRSIRGGALGLVLAVATLALLAAFVAASVSTANLQVANRLSSASVANSLAESVVSEAAAKLQADLGFHDDVTYAPGLNLPPGSIGRLTFNQDASMPYSTNNFLDNQSNGWKRSLPNHTAHLIGVGESGGVTRHVEVLLHQPQYPIALACDGPVQVTRSVILGFSPKDDNPWVPGSGFDVPDDEIKPGNLITNSAATNAVVLDKQTRISGDVQACGSLISNGAKIEGEVRAPWAQKAPLPKFDIPKFDPKNDPDTHYEDIPGTPISLTLLGNSRRQGNLTLSGDLNLDNAFIYVDGDLTIQGALRGTGAIIVSGKCRFKGSVGLESNEEIALLSGGGVEAIGESSARSIFKGLLYTTGPFRAEKLTILGGFIVDNGAPTEVVDCTIYSSGQQITTNFNRQVFAVIPRFSTPNELGAYPPKLFVSKDSRIPTGNWPQPGKVRTVRNVLDQSDPTWERSAWSKRDAAVIGVHWEKEQPKFTYYFWGLDPDSGVELEDVTNRVGAVYNEVSFDSAAKLIEYIKTENTSATAQGFLQGTVPNDALYKAYLQSVTKYLVDPDKDKTDFNFALDPNEFIVDGSDLRVLMHRSF